MTKVVAIAKYENAPRGLYFEAGELIDLTPELWAFLQNDAPENFRVYQENATVDAPASDKAVKRTQAVRK